MEIRTGFLLQVTGWSGRHPPKGRSKTSDYPAFAQFLVTEGIDSLSLNPDSHLKTMLAVVELENRLTHGVREPVPSGATS